MDGKGRIRGHILTLLSSVMFQACQPHDMDIEKVICTVTFDACEIATRSLDPDEDLISDISLMIFDERGDAERCVWMQNGQKSINLELVKGKSYNFRACANFGYQVYADHIAELDEVRYHMTYPDEYREGIPMYAEADGVRPSDNGTISLPLVRLMSKISLRMDRRRLSDSVEIYVRNVKIGNCPKSVSVFTPNSVSHSDQCFALGFNRDDWQASALNTVLPDGKSGEISLYMMENIQGRIEDDDPGLTTCSFIEMEMDYLSPWKYSTSPLIYRFHLGDGTGNRDVERNCHYSITVCPEDDGLSKDGWHVDKSGITADISFNSYPASYINGNIGDKIHVWCEFSPEDTPFDVGISYMEEDHMNGIYDYVIDEDGHGAILSLTGPGTGLIYMEAGEPVNDAALFVIEVNMP